jgi:Nucleoside-diphosphate-sugar pyrophosphorylase involved in lipopolysaccharide biosynthesis/translation initiation factor 2B, gamma/epsilon subunits (eIF-2Bgamma/eIF-2Bepsilon)
MDKAKFRTLLITSDTTLKQSMQRLNETAEKILFVADDSDRLLGTVTDGDIRRGLINGLNFSDNIEKVMFGDFAFIPYDEADKKKKAKTLMLEKVIEQIPILDKNMRVIDVILWTDIFSEEKTLESKQFFTNPVVVMAGGKGTRLDPFTKILPKPLIPIGDKPIIEVIMEKFYKQGFQNFIFTLNYKKEYIKMFLRENSFPYKIDWVEEDEFMGTAGSLSLLKGKMDEPLFVLNCDIILTADYADIIKWHKENNNFVTLIGCHKEVKVPYGILELEDGVLKSFVEKPNYDVIINTGVYLLEPEVIEMIPDNKFLDMNTLIEEVSKREKVSVYPIHDGWMDVGQWEEYKNSLREIGDV